MAKKAKITATLLCTVDQSRQHLGAANENYKEKKEEKNKEQVRHIREKIKKLPQQRIMQENKVGK